MKLPQYKIAMKAEVHTALKHLAVDGKCSMGDVIEQMSGLPLAHGLRGALKLFLVSNEILRQGAVERKLDYVIYFLDKPEFTCAVREAKRVLNESCPGMENIDQAERGDRLEPAGTVPEGFTSVLGRSIYVCDKCEVEFSNTESCLAHIKEVHKSKSHGRKG